MKCIYQYVKSRESVTCEYVHGKFICLPVIPGILKHPHPDQLPELLTIPSVVEKYTKEALRKASWQILSQFPRSWLRECLERCRMKPSRMKALRFLLS